MTYVRFKLKIYWYEQKYKLIIFFGSINFKRNLKFRYIVIDNWNVSQCSRLGLIFFQKIALNFRFPFGSRLET